MTKRQYLAPIAVLPLAALALAGCTPNEPSAGVGAGTTPAVVKSGEVPEQDLEASGSDHGSEGESGGSGAAKASLAKPDGSSAGSATFTEKDGVVVVDLKVTGLPAGFHAVHLHSVGKCEANSTPPGGGTEADFASAGGHWQKPGATGHPMTGDLVSVYVNTNGTGQTVTSTGAFTVNDIKRNSAGVSIMVHADPDNFGNVPPSKYANIVPGQPVPDAQTLATGDAGGRIACGVIKVG